MMKKKNIIIIPKKCSVYNNIEGETEREGGNSYQNIFNKKKYIFSNFVNCDCIILAACMQLIFD